MEAKLSGRLCKTLRNEPRPNRTVSLVSRNDVGGCLSIGIGKSEGQASPETSR
jgi:hypothetical protein